MELIRGWSIKPGACLLMPIYRMSFLNPNIPLKPVFLDKSQIDSEKVRVKVTRHQKLVQDYENFICTGVDCWEDKDTLLYKVITKENSDKKILKSKGPECHLTFTRKMSTLSKYLHIYPTPPFRQDMTQGQFFFKQSLTGLNSEFSFS